MSTEKDAMALAVLERLTDQFGREHGTFGNEDHTLWSAATEARAHLASRISQQAERIALLEQNEETLFRAYNRAEAELAAVRANAERYLHLREANNADPTPFIAQRYEHGIMQWTGEEADAAIDAARGGE